jgi:hydrogenase maturation protein HypF
MQSSAVITVKGLVQGVGFRPFIHRLANKFKLAGKVYNRTGSVRIEACGDKKAINMFYRAIDGQKPAAASIAEKQIRFLKKNFGYRSFTISESRAIKELKFVPPDLKVCGACVDELFDPKNRRYRYPFINCTNCGPRFTIILDTPYDRKNTTMGAFTMCKDCAAEYRDIKDRRYHAEPDACPVCGPAIYLKGRGMPGMTGSRAIEEAKNLLKKGKILAIKGLGGFHLAVNAYSSAAVEALKTRKHRTNKPLAVMSGSVREIRKYAFLSSNEKKLLESSAAPIVLLENKPGSRLAENIAEGLAHTGVFLPYTPLHCLLFDKKLTSLVMTSGNIAEEPIQHNNEEAMRSLSGVADYFLFNNRDINIPADDSVIKPYAGSFVFIRRSRGYVPGPLTVRGAKRSVIGTGALLKNTVCFIKSGNAIMSQHIGDLENNRAYLYFKKTINDFIRFFEIEPEAVVRDMHPDYLSSSFAEEFAALRGIPVFRVQHHHAHLLSVMAENGHLTRTIGVIFDGTGYGTDGNAWGGEFLAGDLDGFERLAHFKYMKLPGGDAAGREAYRSAVSLLSEFMEPGKIKKLYPGYETGAMLKMMDRSVNSPLTSSAGRIFDAAASLAGVCDISGYEAEAPMRLEALAFKYRGKVRPYDFSVETPLVGVSENKIALGPKKGKISGKKETGASPVSTRPPFEIDIIPAIKQIVKERETKGAGYIAAAFHATMANIILDTVRVLSKQTGIKDVALSGGVFQNTVLLRQAINLLKNSGFNVLIHNKLSPNDSSIALGQAVYGSLSQNAKGKSQK